MQTAAGLGANAVIGVDIDCEVITKARIHDAERCRHASAETAPRHDRAAERYWTRCAR
jgi:uncharacterized protein YbjQ (UPF0145 family)